jgi:hypothetical protein
MGKLIRFIPKDPPEMMPEDWKNPYDPTLSELRVTINTVRKHYYRNCEALDYSGIASEIKIRENLRKLECLHATLMDYYRVD